MERDIEETKPRGNHILLNIKTPKHKKVLKIARCTVYCATQQLNPGVSSGHPSMQGGGRGGEKLLFKKLNIYIYHIPYK